MGAAKKEAPPVPPPRADVVTGAAGDILVTFIYEMMKRYLPVGEIERAIENSDGPLRALIDEDRPLGAHARLLADRLVADMEIATDDGGST